MLQLTGGGFSLSPGPVFIQLLKVKVWTSVKDESKNPPLLIRNKTSFDLESLLNVRTPDVC